MNGIDEIVAPGVHLIVYISIEVYEDQIMRIRKTFQSLIVFFDEDIPGL